MEKEKERERDSLTTQPILRLHPVEEVHVLFFPPQRVQETVAAASEPRPFVLDPRILEDARQGMMVTSPAFTVSVLLFSSTN